MPIHTTAPDLLGMRLAHRAMLADTARLAGLTADIAAGHTACPPTRAAAVTEYLLLLCDSIHHHHDIEDTVLWPLLRDNADSTIDLRELEDDHAQLDPLLDGLRVTARAFARCAPESAAELTTGLGHLHTLLTEHIGDEEATIFPVITAQLSAEQWNRVEAAARRGARMSFELPRMFGMCTPEEWERASAEGGLILKLMLRWFGRAHRRRERLINGL
ncbi:hemerythrin domain-containing protein [Nocardia sp. CA-135953]|uniref:hemerythrin domain-containing protein n=1 Tax=Nocardia sp. CA-135953 TaxID=3239978 RepID=UPI003D98E44A